MKVNKDDIFIAFFMLVAIAFFFAFSFYAMAGGKHHNDTVNNYITNEYITQESITNAVNADTDGQTALSNAIAGFDCTYTTERWQIGGGVGFHGNTNRLAVGGCKKVNSVLIKFTVGRDKDKNSGNVFLMFPLN